MGTRGQPLIGRIAAAVLLAALAVPAAALDLPHTIRKPDGPGPFPAVVVMHDCSGLGPRSSGAPGRWSDLLVQAGYVTILPDSFTSRGQPDGVCAATRPPRIPPRQRADDTYDALAHHLAEYDRMYGRETARRLAAMEPPEPLVALVDERHDLPALAGWAAGVVKEAA